MKEALREPTETASADPEPDIDRLIDLSVEYTRAALSRRHECPLCGVEANNPSDTLKAFGIRVNGRSVRAQTFCKACRLHPRFGELVARSPGI